MANNDFYVFGKGKPDSVEIHAVCVYTNVYICFQKKRTHVYFRNCHTDSKLLDWKVCFPFISKQYSQMSVPLAEFKEQIVLTACAAVERTCVPNAGLKTACTLGCF